MVTQNDLDAAVSEHVLRCYLCSYCTCGEVCSECPEGVRLFARVEQEKEGKR